jgi:hypothetical protein
MSVTATANHETTKVEATEATIVWIEVRRKACLIRQSFVKEEANKQ